ADWKQLSDGITQRAELLELVLRDIYGEGRLVAEGALPAAAIAGSPEYLRPVCGIKPPGGRYLSLYAADVGRGPDGRWWVLGDRTQAPSGAGYALENRLVLSRAFTALYKSMNVERVAPFFEAFRDSLRASADRDEPRIGLLTPGNFNETYFEHATLARYLGFLLVEGDDLAVSGDRVHIRTVAGLKRLDVLLRRVDANFLDPLELDASSHLGVPGLIDVLRKSGVVVANMPGSGVLEARALLGFLPNLCRRLLSEDLEMPHIATWWCGQKSAREEVLSRLDDFAIEGAYTRAVPGFSSHGPVLSGELAPAAAVWVVSDKAVSSATLLPAAETVRIRRIAGVVPSRAADNLFWLGRYLERAEATLLLIRALGTPTRDPVKGISTALHSVERIQR